MTNPARSSLLFPMVLLGSSLVACSHTHSLKGGQVTEVTPVASSPIDGKRVVVDTTALKDTYNGRSNGHSVQINGLKLFTQELVKRRLAAAQSVVVAPATGEVVLIPAVNIAFEVGEASHKCAATVTWNVKSAEGAAMATGTAKDQQTFAEVPQAGSMCEKASLTAMTAALDDAFGKMAR